MILNGLPWRRTEIILSFLRLHPSTAFWTFLLTMIANPFLLSDSCTVKVKLLSRVRLFATPWTVAYQAPLSMGFSRQEYWSGLPFPSPGDLPHPGVELESPALQADSLLSEPPGNPIYTELASNPTSLGLSPTD